MAEQGPLSLDPEFGQAVAAIDEGDISALERLVTANPRLLRDRAEGGEGYFHRPYLLWFVAENPVRNDTLPANIVEVTRAIIEAARRQRVETLKEQLDDTLALVASGRVVRERGAQIPLIDLLVDAGANPNALHGALAHREVAAAKRLLERGAKLTLAGAIVVGREEDAGRLAREAGRDDLQIALIAAAIHGLPEGLRLLIRHGADVRGYGPEGFHPHATPLHQAVFSGSLQAVKVLSEAGAPLDVRDKCYDATPLGWAEYGGHTEIAAYLRANGG